MQNRRKKGQLGEDIAVAFLKQKGYQIICRNFKKLGGEIDIIARFGRAIIVVEVKSKSANAPFLPDENISDQKIKKIMRTFDFFLDENPAFEKFDPQIDLIFVENFDNPQIEHFENIMI